MKERIKNLLIGGMKASEISSVVGCSPSYISQLVASVEFKKSVEDGVMAAASERKEEDHLDIRYQNTEHKLITAMEQTLGEASLGEITRALEVVGRRREAKRASVIPASPGVTIHNVVSLVLPAHALKEQPIVSLNGNREIIAIDAQPLAPMSSTGVKNLFEQMRVTKTTDAELAILDAENF